MSQNLRKFALLFWYVVGGYLCFESAAYLWQVATLRSIASAPITTVAHWSDLRCRSSSCKITWTGYKGFISQRSGNGVLCSMGAFSLLRSPTFASLTQDGGLIDLTYSKNSPQHFCIGSSGPQPSARPLFPLLVVWLVWALLKTSGRTSLVWLLEVSGYAEHPWYTKSKSWTSAQLETLQKVFAARPSVYNVHLYGMLIEVFWSDGILDAKEARLFEELVTKMAYGADPAHMGALQAAMREHKTRKVTFEDDARAFRTEVGANPLALEVALDWLIRAAASNGIIDRQQKALLFHAAKIFDIPQKYVTSHIEVFAHPDEARESASQDHQSADNDDPASSRGFFEAEKSSEKSQHPLAWAYRELHCEVGAPDPEVKKRYREAVLNYHPDRLRVRGLPPDLVENAHRRFLGVQKAYEALCA